MSRFIPCLVRRVNPYIVAAVLGFTLGGVTAFAGCFDIRANAAELQIEPLEIPGADILSVCISRRPFGWKDSDPAPLTYGELDQLLDRMGKAEARQLQLEERLARLETQHSDQSKGDPNG